MDKPQVFYTAVATATGSGRDGHVATDDGLVEFDLATPKPGAAATRTNPEQPVRRRLRRVFQLGAPDDRQA
ncbi:hypothetical protein GCM10025876_00960 [Demequina litorisediminis]|uniref:Organic hydroperoxide resistance protein n=1 Tax=Demequina litorisediminis TaxID=1849022 RepID=A0ABQ6IA62_9MICO|nr:hypothetical protein GCM10025876_00960 [Demequina litorisediminis]